MDHDDDCSARADARHHLLAPAAVMAVVLLMVVPLPPLMLDLLLSIDIGLSVVLLLTVIYVKQPVEFSVFPSLLLLLTLMRLSLNVASTRLILMHGQDGVDAAGHVIMSFGQFVVGGNFIVGIVVFLVLVAIQFIVINHGAVRISEVTARFTLDAMPGRQMAIDADLNAGLIDEREARTRRDRVRREADFYGAMDGAIRFTQRDALAAVLITGVNIIAGLIIGVFQHGLDLGTAAQTYTILTVGEGLVTAIPALLVSMSGGLITTRAASESNLGEEVAVQLLARARPLAVAAAVLTGLALIPGLPKMSFLVVAALLGGAALRDARESRRAAAGRRADATPPPKPRAPAPVDPLSIEIGYALVALADDKQGGTLLNRLRAIRKQIAARDRRRRAAGARRRQPAARSAHLRDSRQGRRSGARRARSRSPAGDQSRNGHRRRSKAVPTREPAFGLPAWWIPHDAARTRVGGRLHRRRPDDRAVDAPVGDDSRTFLPDLLSRQQTKELLDRVGADVAEAGRGARAEDGVGRRHSARAAAAAARARAGSRSGDDSRGDRRRRAPAPRIRTRSPKRFARRMGRTICRQYQNERGELPAISFAPALEAKLMSSIVPHRTGRRCWRWSRRRRSNWRRGSPTR